MVSAKFAVEAKQENVTLAMEKAKKPVKRASVMDIVGTATATEEKKTSLVVVLSVTMDMFTSLRVKGYNVHTVTALGMYRNRVPFATAQMSVPSATAQA